MRYYKSQYSESRYFTPPKVDPIGLDLAKLSGGGYAPAQYYGETHDGREVYCRYRGGGLTVTLANEPGRDALDDGTCLLDVTIGPPLHGGMTLGQLCHYAGLTVEGRCPPLPTPQEMHEENAYDLSGAITFYSVWIASTFNTQKRFLKAALETSSDLHLVYPLFASGPEERSTKVTGFRVGRTLGDLDADSFFLFFGPEPNEAALDPRTMTTLRPEMFPQNLVVSVHTRGFKYPMRKYGNNVADRVEKATGLAIAVAGQSKDCLHAPISLRTFFGKDDESRLGLVRRLDGLLDEVFPKVRVSYTDIVTGGQVAEPDYLTHLDPDVVNWINAADNRYLHVSPRREQDQQHWLGTRATLAG